MVVIMIGRITTEKKDFCGAPGNVETTVSLGAELEFPNLPEKESEAMCSIT
jgi:hypothetical protein